MSKVSWFMDTSFSLFCAFLFCSNDLINLKPSWRGKSIPRTQTGNFEEDIKFKKVIILMENWQISMNPTRKFSIKKFLSLLNFMMEVRYAMWYARHFYCSLNKNSLRKKGIFRLSNLLRGKMMAATLHNPLVKLLRLFCSCKASSLIELTPYALFNACLAEACKERKIILWGPNSLCSWELFNLKH